MNYKYFPHTDAEMNEMLAVCGKRSLDELFDEIPEEIQFKREYDLPSEMSEVELRRFFAELGAKNKPLTCFAGAGCYDHYSPAVISHIISRSEFLTSYTPYQAEISQGTLQYIFEFQSMMSELTGMEVGNASMYDGATATAEAMMMAVSAAKKRNKVLVAQTLNPNVKVVLETYAKYQGIEIDYIAEKGGVSDKADFEEKVAKGDVAGVIVATPNYYGILEDYEGWADACKAQKALLVMNCQASALGAIKSPGEWGADIAAGDGQSLGIPMNFGGPYVGFLCTKKALIRKMPGRVVGATKDLEGRRSFVLTLQAREQHIRREKATSNICSNQSLMALYVTIYMALMGAKGLKEVNELGYSGAHYLAEQLCATGKCEMAYPGQPYLNEFAVKTKVKADQWLSECEKHGILGGVKVGEEELLVCVTEMRSKAEMDRLVDIVKQIKA